MPFPVSPDSAPPRSPTEVPSLWILVITGSLVIHGAAFLGLRSLSLQEPVTLPDVAPIAIELVPATPDSAAVAPAATASAQPSVQSAPAQVPLPEVKNSQTRASGDLKSSPPPEPAIAPAPVAAHPIPKAAPPQVLKPAAAKPPTPSSAASLPSTSDAPATSNMPLPGLPKVPNSAPTTAAADSSALGALEISRSAVPARFLAAIEISPSPTNRSFNGQPVSARSTPPTASEVTKTFISDPSECLLTPEAAHYFGQSVVFKVLPDAKGTLQAANAVEVQESSGSDRYDELAACALKTWTFKPVSGESGSTVADTPSPFNVNVTIRQP